MVLLKLSIAVFMIAAPSRVYTEPDKPILDDIQAKTLLLAKEIRTKYSKYQCFKLKSCRSGGEKICAYDEDTAKLAVFEDKCTMHKANCKLVAMFVERNMKRCYAGEGTKKNFIEDEKIEITPVSFYKKNKEVTTYKPYDPYGNEQNATTDNNYAKNSEEVREPKGKIQFVKGVPNKYYLK